MSAALPTRIPGTLMSSTYADWQRKRGLPARTQRSIRQQSGSAGRRKVPSAHRARGGPMRLPESRGDASAALFAVLTRQSESFDGVQAAASASLANSDDL